MRTDLYKDINDPDAGFDEEYIKKLLDSGDMYLLTQVSPLKCYAEMDDRLNEVYTLTKMGKLAETDFKYVMMSFANGYTFHPRKLASSFDFLNKYIAFDKERACYVSISEENLINYLSDNIERADFEKWLEETKKKLSKENKDDQKAEDDLLKEIEEA